MTPTPETPRTDAVAQTQVCGNPLPFEYVHVSFARQLERELAEAKSWLDERYKALSEADERAEKAEAEVERLRHLLTEASYRIHELDFVREIEKELNKNNK